MAKKSYHVVDSSGKKVGFLALDVVATPQESPSLFESISPTIQDAGVPIETVEKSSFWQSDGIKYSLAGLFSGVVILAYSWWSGSDLGALAAAAAIASGLGLHFYKIFRLHPAAQPSNGKAEAETVIKVEHWSDDNAHVEIDYLEDETIKPDELSRFAAAVVENDLQWLGRNKMCNLANLSQPKYGKIRDELIRLNYAHNGVGNTTVLSLRGKAFLRQLAATLP